MRNSTYVNIPAELAEVAPRAVSTRGDQPLVFLRRGPAANDPSGIIVAAIRAAVAIARRVQARYRQRRDAKATYDALRQLDDRMLHDLGFDRSEMTSVAAETTGEAERTRVRALPTSYGLPM